MGKKKQQKFQITWNHIFLAVFFLGICYNTYIHKTHRAYQYYRDNIQRLESDLKQYRDIINRDILTRLSALTNIVPLISRSPLQYVTDEQDPEAVYTVSPSNYPSFKFDSYFESGKKQFARSGIKYFSVGDEINGLKIQSISPQFVQIADRFFPIGNNQVKEINK